MRRLDPQVIASALRVTLGRGESVRTDAQLKRSNRLACRQAEELERRARLLRGDLQQEIVSLEMRILRCEEMLDIAATTRARCAT